MEGDNKTTLEAHLIRPVNTETVHKICSGQVVLSLAVAIKELVENALDAGSTTIDIRLKNYGIDLIEVSDNGCGVHKHNFAALTLKYHTSKLNDYSELLEVTSLGFRGEALSSLCSLSDLSITTRHKSCDFATKLEYDKHGHISKSTPCARQVGTTVTLCNLFSTLPVRQKDFHKNVKREFNKMTQLLYGYCLVSKGVKITCTNQTASNSKNLVVATQGSSYKDNVASVFGSKQLLSLIEFKPDYEPSIKDNIMKGLSNNDKNDHIENGDDLENVVIDLSEDSNDADTQTQRLSQGHRNVPDPIHFDGLISTCMQGSGRSTTDRQFFYVNSRPCEPTKVIKVINEVYKQYNPNQYPFVFLNLIIERNTVDINVTPDKRKVFLTKENLVLEALKKSLIKLYESLPRTFKVETNKLRSNDVVPDVSRSSIFNSFLHKSAKSNENNNTRTVRGDENDNLKRKSTTMLDFISKKAIKLDTTKNEEEEKVNSPIHEEIDIKFEEMKTEANSSGSETNTSINELNKDSSRLEASIKADIKSEANSSGSETNISINEVNKESPNKDKSEMMFLEYTDELPKTQIRKLDDVVLQKSTINCKTSSPKPQIKPVISNKNIVTDKSDLGKNHRKVITMKTSLEHIKLLAETFNKENARKSQTDKVKFRSTIDPVHNKKCEEELTREISKDSFKQMVVVGQFNLGFIITRLDDDLFIIDQHATDEIYNFEMLQKNTELTSQKLVIPQQLELTGVNEQILMDNLQIFKKNGFTFEINEQAPPTKRVKLVTIPMSKNWVFGKGDIEELLFMLRESPSDAENCRPSRVRAMFASRACRKSVMIGTALAHCDMNKLVVHMADIDKPWNCPHGRPTIRHLVNFEMVHTKR